MDLKEERTAKPEDSTKEEQEGRKEVPSEGGAKAQAKQAEIEKKEDFDPDTADRDTWLARCEELEDQLGEAEERVLRAAADAENFKKRLQREKEEQTRYANESFMRELLPVIDNLERALEHSQAESNQGSMVEGLKITLKVFIETLAKFGCTPIEAVGEPFDPNFHEAVSQEEAAEHEVNAVVRELQKGYMLKDRLLRPAMVVVSKPPSQKSDATEEKETGGQAKAEKGEVKIKVKKVQ